jgi:hypothetical protein
MPHNADSAPWSPTPLHQLGSHRSEVSGLTPTHSPAAPRRRCVCGRRDGSAHAVRRPCGHAALVLESAHRGGHGEAQGAGLGGSGRWHSRGKETHGASSRHVDDPGTHTHSSCDACTRVLVREWSCLATAGGMPPNERACVCTTSFFPVTHLDDTGATVDLAGATAPKKEESGYRMCCLPVEGS